MNDVWGALDVVPVLCLASTTAMTIAATTITATTVATAAHIAAVDEARVLAGGTHVGGVDGGGAEVRTGRAEPALGRECTTGISGAASAATAGAAVFLRYWARFFGEISPTHTPCLCKNANPEATSRNRL